MRSREDWQVHMSDEQPKNKLHGVTLEQIVNALVAHYGWVELGKQIDIRCFQSDPSVSSSLKFLRRTPWARAKVESLYLFMLRERARAERLFHGTKADLKPGDLIEAGRVSNYGKRKPAVFVYLTATLDAATWGAELASGEGRGRIYVVEPTGPFEDDPNLTDKKFPGNPTKSYRSRAPLRVIGEITDWQGHAPEQLQALKDHLPQLAAQGIEAIED
jgi:rifampin ADP-ribosylating transferase